MSKNLDSWFHGFKSGTEVFTMELEYWIFRQAEDELERRKLVLEEKKCRWFCVTVFLMTIYRVKNYEDNINIKTLRLQALAGRLLDLESQMLSLWEKSPFYFNILNNVNPAITWSYTSKIKSMQIKEWGCEYADMQIINEYADQRVGLRICRYADN